MPVARRSFVDAFVPVAVTDRSGRDESVHHGAVVALDTSGAVALAIGDVDVEMFGRSSNKPMQADAMLRCGLVIDDEELALACASHDGTDRHVAVTRRILTGAGLDDTALGNTADLPLDRTSAETLLAHGDHRRPVYMNCSGKHAAMVATCVVNGWPVDSYLDRHHPLQLAIIERIAELTGGVPFVGVDGCGAPAHVTSLVGLARAFGVLAGERGPVWRAMTAHPDLVGGEHRLVTRMMRQVPDLMAKDGAEGVFAAALPDGRAAAVKIADGAARPAATVLAAALAAIGVEIDPAALADPVLGHGEPVGTVRTILDRQPDEWSAV